MLNVGRNAIGKRLSSVFGGLGGSLFPAKSVRRPLAQNTKCRFESSFTVFPAEGSSQSAYSILLVTGGWVRGATIGPCASKLAAKGYETGIVDFADRGSVQGQVRELSQAVQHLGPFTIIVAYSISGFVAQRYLESWACAGLVLINSLPHTPQTALNRLLAVDNELEFGKALDAMKYSGFYQSLLDPPTIPVGEKLLSGTSNETKLRVQEISCSPETKLLRDIYSQRVNLEPGAVPVLVLQSELDNFISVDEAASLAAFHHGELRTIGNAPHIISLDKNACSTVLEAIEQWIEYAL